MKDNGIIYRGLLTAGIFNSGTTGVDPHEDAGGALFINAIDFDLEKLLNIPTAKIHTEVVIFPWAYPDSSSATHFGTYASSLMGGDQYPPHEASWKPWLSQLSYEQTILDGKLNFELGKSNLLRYFFTPTCGLDFYCIDVGVKKITGTIDPATGTLTGRVKYNINSNWNAEFGAQQIREFTASQRNYGWNITDNSGGDGTFFVGAVRYFNNEGKKNDLYEFNTYYADTTVTNPADSSDTHRGTSGAVFKFNKLIYSSDSAHFNPTVKWFGSLSKIFDEDEIVNVGVIQGLNISDLTAEPIFGKITLDQVTMKVNYVNINDNQLISQRNKHMALGGTSEMTNPNQFRFELSTTLGLTKNIKLQPVVEYIVNPDTYMSTNSKELPRDGWLFGAMLGISLGN